MSYQPKSHYDIHDTPRQGTSHEAFAGPTRYTTFLDKAQYANEAVLPRSPSSTMFTNLATLMNTDMSNYATTYTETRAAYLLAAKNLKEATGPYKATRDAYVAATATYTKSLYE